MNEELLKQLKAMNLLPIEVDPEARKELSEFGTYLFKAETHYTPGTPKRVIERIERIRENTLKLLDMERDCPVELGEYKRIETELRKDLFESVYPTVEDVLDKMAGEGGPYTGTGGRIRDDI